MKQKSRALLINNDEITIIKRTKDSEEYYVFPGGSVEDGEDSVQALHREMAEELGIKIEIKRLFAEIILHNNEKSTHEYFYLCTQTEGVLGSGYDKKFVSDSEYKNNYQIVTVKIADIKNLNLRPVTIRDALVEGVTTKA